MDGSDDRRDRIHVLLVDDDHDLRSTTAELLRERGYQVTTAADGVEAIAMARRSPPSILILDVEMPVMNGREFLAWRRAEGGPLTDIPVIMLSGHGAMDEAAAVQREVSAWIQKPVDAEVLDSAIERAWRRARHGARAAQVLRVNRQPC